MSIDISDFWNSLKTQYPDAIEVEDQSTEVLIASGARVLFGPWISAMGKQVQVDILRRAADGTGWDVIAVERPQLRYEDQVKKLRLIARTLEAAGFRVYSFIYLSQNPEARADESAARWLYENISRDVIDASSGS